MSKAVIDINLVDLDYMVLTNKKGNKLTFNPIEEEAMSSFFGDTGDEEFNNWIDVEDHPLYVKVGDEIEIKEDTPEGIIVALRVYNTEKLTGYWFIERCIIDDDGELIVLHDHGDEYYTGWYVQNVEYWQPFPKPPLKFEYK